jgi:hypothetical protein
MGSEQEKFLRNRIRRDLSYRSLRRAYSYILYRPMSSPERPSSYLRSSSLVDFSEMALELFELFSCHRPVEGVQAKKSDRVGFPAPRVILSLKKRVVSFFHCSRSLQ